MGDDQQDDGAYEYTDGFDGYEETTNDPGIWLLLGTTIFCVSSMLILMPLFVCHKLGKRNDSNTQDESEYVMVEDNIDEEDVQVSARYVLKFDKETRSLLKLAVPFTISSLASTVFSTLCFIIVSHNVLTLEITAYAIVCVLVGLTDGILYGPISACTTLCAHAVGAGNVKLAGTYLQLAVLMYVGGSALVFAFWWFYMYEAILWLEWGDEETALIGQTFIRHYMWNYILTGISSSLWQLLEIADHVKEGTYVSILWGLVNVVVITAVSKIVPQMTLVNVAWVYNFTAGLFVLIAYIMAEMGGWLKPFKEGLFRTFSLKVSPCVNSNDDDEVEDDLVLTNRIMPLHVEWSSHQANDSAGCSTFHWLLLFKCRCKFSVSDNNSLKPLYSTLTHEGCVF